MKYATTIHLSPEDLVSIIEQHLALKDAQVHFKIEAKSSGKPGESELTFTGADVKLHLIDTQAADRRYPM